MPSPRTRRASDPLPRRTSGEARAAARHAGPRAAAVRAASVPRRVWTLRAYESAPARPRARRRRTYRSAAGRSHAQHARACCHRCSPCWLLGFWTRSGENERRARRAQLLERKRRRAQQRIDESQPINEIRCRLIATLDHWKDVGLGDSIGIGRRASAVICLPLIHLVDAAILDAMLNQK